MFEPVNPYVQSHTNGNCSFSDIVNYLKVKSGIFVWPYVMALQQKTYAKHFSWEEVES